MRRGMRAVRRFSSHLPHSVTKVPAGHRSLPFGRAAAADTFGHAEKAALLPASKPGWESRSESGSRSGFRSGSEGGRLGVEAALATAASAAQQARGCQQEEWRGQQK